MNEEEIVNEKPKDKKVDAKKVGEEAKKPKEKKFGAVKQVDEEETITEKPKEKSAEPEEKKADEPKKKTTEVKRKSIGEKKPKKAEDEPKIESIDEPDFIKADGVADDDLKPASKPSSRRGSKKEKSPEKITPSIEVHVCFATKTMSFALINRHLHTMKFIHNPIRTQQMHLHNLVPKIYIFIVIIYVSCFMFNLYLFHVKMIGSCRRAQTKIKGHQKERGEFTCSLSM